jgi:hypothetical protein
MATGMEMMLKALGFDPQQMLEIVETMKAAVLDVNARLGRVEDKVDQLRASVSNIADALVRVHTANPTGAFDGERNPIYDDRRVPLTISEGNTVVLTKPGHTVILGAHED